MKSFLGKYNPFIDHAIHIILSMLVALIFFFLEHNSFLAVVIFLAGILIDLDHFLNPFMAKIFKLPAQKISFGNSGVTIKIIHGIDVAIFIGWIGYAISNLTLFAIFLTINLVVHEFWDFLVYNHTAYELFLTTRLIKHFQPGSRNYLCGIIFDKETLRM